MDFFSTTSRCTVHWWLSLYKSRFVCKCSVFLLSITNIHIKSITKNATKGKKCENFIKRPLIDVRDQEDKCHTLRVSTWMAFYRVSWHHLLTVVASGSQDLVTWLRMVTAFCEVSRHGVNHCPMGLGKLTPKVNSSLYLAAFKGLFQPKAKV